MLLFIMPLLFEFIVEMLIQIFIFFVIASWLIYVIYLALTKDDIKKFNIIRDFVLMILTSILMTLITFVLSFFYA
jgi:hypothetical protein